MQQRRVSPSSLLLPITLDGTSLTEPKIVEHQHHHQDEGIVLVPQPSDDPADPLNWKMWKKNMIIFTLCFASFGSLASVGDYQLALFPMAATWHVAPPTINYGISAAVSGAIVGPYLIVPLTSIFGKTSVSFWSLVATLACNIWAPLMTGENDYVPWVISRLLAGMFGTVPIVLASGYVMDMYFLHQRGKAFNVLEVAFIFGLAVPSTLGGFIAATKPWPFEFWWLIALNGFSVILAFFTLHETAFVRPNKEGIQWIRPQRRWLTDRILTFFPGHRMVPPTPSKAVLARYVIPFRIAFSPITIFSGIFVMCVLGFQLGLAVASSVFLQTPVSMGGYGYNIMQNSYFNFSFWVGMVMCWVVGALVADRVPLRMARKYGAWHPEYRLVNTLFIIVTAPIGLGIYGAGLQYHTHVVALAVGAALVFFAGTYSTPISVNYITECFPDHPLEVSIVMTFWRQVFGLFIPFFIFDWADKVGVGWVYGMQAFFCLFASSFIGILLTRGAWLRAFNLIKTRTEDGVRLVIDSSSYRTMTMSQASSEQISATTAKSELPATAEA